MGPRFENPMTLTANGVEFCGPTGFTDDHPYTALTVRSVTVIQNGKETTFEFLAVATAPADEWMQVVKTTAIDAGDATIIGHALRDAAPTTRNWTAQVTFNPAQ